MGIEHMAAVDDVHLRIGNIAMAAAGFFRVEVRLVPAPDNQRLRRERAKIQLEDGERQLIVRVIAIEEQPQWLEVNPPARE